MKKSTPHNKSDEASVSLVKQFIEHLPVVHSHYYRNKSKKSYLPHEFRNKNSISSLSGTFGNN